MLLRKLRNMDFWHNPQSTQKVLACKEYLFGPLMTIGPDNLTMRVTRQCRAECSGCRWDTQELALSYLQVQCRPAQQVAADGGEQRRRGLSQREGRLSQVYSCQCRNALEKLGHRLPDQIHQDAQLRLLPAHQSHMLSEKVSVKDEAGGPHCIACRPCCTKANNLGIPEFFGLVYTAINTRGCNT